MSLYPLKFHPILKERIWGGEKLKNLFNKDTQLEKVGESWELSNVEGNISVASNGELKGKTLKEILAIHKADLVGDKVYKQFGNNFPLLIKYIDAKSDLSIQLHPNDELAAKRHNSFGKTEMWYVMQADDDAKLIIDFNKGTTKEDYVTHLKNKTLPDILNFELVKNGDTFFIEVGRVHAIGAGVLLAEIQQTSDITYRIYDWDRVDDQGNSRDLHTELAIDAINFSMPDNYKATYTKISNKSNELVSCPYFTTNFLPITHELKKENSVDSFLIYMCVNGHVKFVSDGIEVDLKMGETVLLPASLSHFEIYPKVDSELLEVYIK